MAKTKEEPKHILGKKAKGEIKIDEPSITEEQFDEALRRCCMP